MGYLFVYFLPPTDDCSRKKAREATAGAEDAGSIPMEVPAEIQAQ